jgi:hypothetical protein
VSHRAALAVAALLGKAAVAAVLLRAGADVNAVSTNRDAPTSVLQYAVRGRSAAIYINSKAPPFSAYQACSSMVLYC